MIRVAMLSANLGAYDEPAEWPEQIVDPGVTVDVHRFTDTHFPPRPLAMTSRLQCGIVKMFGSVQFVKGYDVYVWIDASCAPTSQAVAWFLHQLRGNELAVFRHPDRRTIREEYEFIVERMARPGERYLNSRYRGEWMAQLYREIAADQTYTDDALYASTAFAYRPTPGVQRMMEQWWLTKSRFCLHDQIAWPYVIAKSGCSVQVIEQSYLQCQALTFIRKGRGRL